MLRVGDQIGPYTLLQKIGRGNFGSVWLAERTTIIAKTRVALKIPHTEDVDMEAIKQEAAVWVEASGHPNVLPIIEANVYDDTVVIASEYAPDGSLKDWLKKYGDRAPSIVAAVEMTLGILSGLDHLHAKRIVHRDLKPENILLQGNTPRLADFGLSRVVLSGSQSSIVAGTPHFMAPEAFKGKRNEQTDLWAVGVIFYQLVSGRLPFSGSHAPEVMAAILNEEPAILTDEVPEAIREFIRDALQKKPERRYRSAEQMRGELLEALPNFARALGRRQSKPEQSQPTLVQPAHDIHLGVADTVVVGPSTPSGGADARNVEPIVSQPPVRLDYQTFEFETVTLDGIGKVAGRRRGKARQFIEELAPGVNLEMVAIPGGPFTMGSPKEEETSGDNERPQHEVTVSSFHIGKFTVTQSQWRVVAGWPRVERDLDAAPSHFKGEALPVERVSWEEAVEFCARLANRTGRPYRLPTDAEWEYACRAGTNTAFAFGETISPEFVNYDGNYPYGKAAGGLYREKTMPAGSLGVANEFGLYDMHGNVWEWCQDWYGRYQGEPVTNPPGPASGEYRVPLQQSAGRPQWRHRVSCSGWREDSLALGPFALLPFAPEGRLWSAATRRRFVPEPTRRLSAPEGSSRTRVVWTLKNPP